MAQQKHRSEISLGKMTWRFPDLLTVTPQMRSYRGNEYHDWPDWCFVPKDIIDGSLQYSILGDIPPEKVPEKVRDEFHHWSPKVPVLLAWSQTKGIYRFDPTLFDELVTQELERIPTEILLTLPEWCVYIEIPKEARNMEGFTGGIEGFFACLDWWEKEELMTLRLLICGPDDELPLHYVLNRGDKTLSGIVEATMDDFDRYLKPGAKNDPRFIRRIFYEGQAKPILNLLLYICSSNAEYGTAKRPVKPTNTRGKRALPKASHFWQMGMRIGSEIRSYREGSASPQETIIKAGNIHASPAPHMRRAHWHSFWTGPRDGERVLKVKWLPPTPVNVGDEVIQTVVHKVKK